MSPPELTPAVIRGAGLMVPVALTIAAALWRRPARPALAGALLATIWNLPALFLVHRLAGAAGWWTFDATGGQLDGLPVDLWLGWALLWGAIPVLALPRVPVAVVVAGAVALDVLLMPGLAPVLVLAGGWHWLPGEAAAAALALVPALLLGRWTADQRHLGARVALQVVLAGGLMLWLLPVAALAGTGSPERWLRSVPGWRLGFGLQLLAVPVVVAVTAVTELATRGGGTPVPYDPPPRLVTSGPYAYLANPMQTGMTLLLLGWGALLGSWEMAGAGAMAAVYGAGLAAWHEGVELRERHGPAWTAYRGAVRSWWPRWRPYVPAPATLYLAASCAPCSEMGAWFAARHPAGLALRPAEEAGGLRRLTWVAADGTTERGIRAFARALEHLHLGWALAGWVLRLPLADRIAQLLLDAAGGGPRDLDPAASPRAPWSTGGR
jgi:protein-S-isoprenylcysteine O-methyltransferase Ste14